VQLLKKAYNLENIVEMTSLKTELINVCTTQPDSSELLAQFVANQLKNRKDIFLRFFKTTLTLFSNKAFSKLKGIKIKVKVKWCTTSQT
jgi:hypothetical protein